MIDEKPDEPDFDKNYIVVQGCPRLDDPFRANAFGAVAVRPNTGVLLL